MTADFGNFVAKNDEKRKTKDEMNPALDTLRDPRGVKTFTKIFHK